MFLFFRPEPKFRIDLLVERDSPHHPNCRHMIIKSRRYGRVRGEPDKQWLYDGLLLVVIRGKAGEKGDVEYVSKIYDVPENHLRFIPGIV